MMQNSPVEKAVGGVSFGAISQDVNRASRNDNEGLSMATSVLGISGSLRAGSFNTAALRVAKELAPEGMTIEIADISQIPLYNEDVYQQGFPPSVDRFRDQIRAADALLFATPEYNFSISGVLKNAIDWASRPPAQPFNGKPAAMLGASAGRAGTARAQLHLRHVLSTLNAHVLNKPDVLIATAQNMFDDNGKLTDEATRKFVRQELEALLGWTEKLA